MLKTGLREVEQKLIGEAKGKARPGSDGPQRTRGQGHWRLYVTKFRKIKGQGIIF